MDKIIMTRNTYVNNNRIKVFFKADVCSIRFLKRNTRAEEGEIQELFCYIKPYSAALQHNSRFIQPFFFMCKAIQELNSTSNKMLLRPITSYLSAPFYKLKILNIAIIGVKFITKVGSITNAVNRITNHSL